MSNFNLNIFIKFLIELRLFANEIEVVENLQKCLFFKLFFLTNFKSTLENFCYFSLPDLQSLQLQSNKIKRLNKGLFFLRKLEYLRLDQNKLVQIEPSEISACSNIIYLNISHNKLESIAVCVFLWRFIC